MSSSQLFIAYSMKDRESPARIELRTEHAERHLAPLHRKGMHRQAAGDGGSGFIYWTPEGQPIDWPFCRVDDNGEGVAWLHVPSAAGGPDSGADPRTLADDLFAGRLDASDLASPFAVARWRAGTLEIINDVYGLVRLFHYDFPEGEVWATRMGLAHVFMGVEPTRNSLAWDGMATLGWAPSGTTQLGDGRQLRGGTRIETGFNGRRRFRRESSTFADWFAQAREQQAPPLEKSVPGMYDVMRTALRWPEAPIADLSGGKDSRAVVAVGYRSGAIQSVRTIATDHGEVSTAQQLVALVDGEIRHAVQDRPDPVQPGEDFIERITSQHQAFEGRYLATTAYNLSTFQGFELSRRARFNGLGGEVLAGGNLIGAWRERLDAGGVEVARTRLARIAHNGRGASARAIEAVAAELERYVEHARSLEITTGTGVLDLFYNLDKMPNWSITFSTPDTLCPLFAPGLLDYGTRTLGNPAPVGAVHREIVRAAIPAWADVPFYKPSVATRIAPLAWEMREWPEVRAHLEALASADELESYSPDGIREAIKKADSGAGARLEDLLIRRILWDSTFETYLSSVQKAARSLRAELDAPTGGLLSISRWWASIRR